MSRLVLTGKLSLLLGLGFFGLVACGGGGGGGSGEVPSGGGAVPEVIAHSPQQNATGVPVEAVISATFSEPIDPAAIGGSFDLVDDQGFSEPGAVAYEQATRVATFTPDLPLAADTRYTATIAAEFEDPGGNLSGIDFSWSFTTGPAPELALVVPADQALEVPVDAAIQLVFSEAMDSATLSGQALEVVNLSDGGVPVAGALNYDPDSLTATFSPSQALFVNTTYQVTLHPGPADLAGNPLAAEVVWTFTTETSILPPPPPFP